MARVLVLDDDVEIARMVGRVVELHGHEALIETSSMDALMRHGSGATRISAAIVDLMMPRLTGIEVLTGFQESAPRVRRVLLTAAPQEAEVRAAVTSGVVQMLISKPPTLSDLERALLWLPQ
jgi:CheY-like chemotaxis protein